MNRFKSLTLYMLPVMAVLFLLAATGPRAMARTGETKTETHAGTGGNAKITANTALDSGLSERMHPAFPLKDKDGKVLTGPEDGDISSVVSCAGCHDTDYINKHNLHYNKWMKSDCITCHFKGAKMEGDYTQAHLRVQLPDNDNCAQCHGIIHGGSEAMAIPADYAARAHHEENEPYYNITQKTGVILSPQDLAASGMNIKDKEQRNFPWDIHARRQLKCISCHFTANDPRYCGTTQSALDHLVRDPRKIGAPHQYLKRPDHDLKAASCTCCHDPYKVHDGMPYKKRHMEVLSCQSCHVPEVFAPALRAVDRTVVKSDGAPRMEFRGYDDSKSHGDSLNTRYMKGFSPVLLAHKYEGKNLVSKHLPLEGGHDSLVISPFNLVSYWGWASKSTGKRVGLSTLKDIYLNGSTYKADILTVFDADGNGTLDEKELVLDTEQKIDLIKNKLSAAGIAEPVITGKVKAYKINHGVANAKLMKRDCYSCHTGKSDSKFNAPIVLAANIPGGVMPDWSALSSLEPLVDGEVKLDQEGRAVLQRAASIPGHYVFGHSRLRVVDQVGFLLFLLSLLFVFVHGLLRYKAYRKRGKKQIKTEMIYMYSKYERIWHWVMALGVLLLALTGLEIHYAGSITLFGLQAAVSIHNLLAKILVINAALSLFYHIASGEIRKFFGFNRKFLHETVMQAYYYAYGIFKHHPHPVAKTLERRLNPLQQLVYVGLLNILLPFQVLTGIVIMGMEKWPEAAAALGGLSYLAPLHNLGSWMFIAFLTAHIYLITTGHKPGTLLKAMITGYDEVETEHAHQEHAMLMDMKFMDLTGTLIGKMLKREQAEKDK